LKIQAPDSADVSMYVTCAEVLTGTEQKYFIKPKLENRWF